MKKDKYIWGNLDRLTNLIRTQQPITEEDKEIWKEVMQQIDIIVDRPVTGTEVTINKKQGYTLLKGVDTFNERKPTLIRKFKNWLIKKLKEKEA